MSRKTGSILKQTGIYLIARGLPGIAAFLAIPVLTRLLDPAAYGRYALVSATVGLLNALLFQWLRLALVRYLPAFKDDPAPLKSTLLAVELRLIAAVAAVGGAACLVPALAPWRAVVAACVIVLALQATFELFLEHARAQIDPWRYMSLLLARSALSTALGAVLALAGLNWWGPVAGLAIGLAAPGAYAWFRDWRHLRLHVDRAVLRKLCAYGIPLSVTVALAVVIGTSDRFIIAWKLGDDAAGLYSVAVDFTTQTLTLLMMVVYLAMFPLAVRAYEGEGRAAAQEQMQHNATLLMLVGVPAVAGLVVLAPGISHTFFGERYRAAASGVIPLVALGSFLAGLKAYHFDSAFQFVHKTVHQVWIVLVAAVVNVALNLLVVRRFGINGSAAASVVAYTVSIALTVAVGRRHFTLPFPPVPFAQVTAAACVMAAALWPFRLSLGAAPLAAQVAAGAAVYGGVLVLANFQGVRTRLAGRFLSRSGSGGGPVPIVDAPAREAA